MPSPTIKDVARAAGFSVATVSYVINDGPRQVTPETRARVLEAMRQLGYEPNASARRLRLNRTHVIGLAVSGLSGLPGMADLYFLDVIRGISIAADRADYHLMLFTNAKKLQTPEFFRSLIRQRLFDGLLLLGSIFPPAVTDELEHSGRPAVIVGRHHIGLNLPRIRYAYEDEIYQTTTTLLDRGYRRIALILNHESLISERERLRGYRRALADRGQTFDPALVYQPTRLEIYPARETVHRIALELQPDVIVSQPYREVCDFLNELYGPSDGVPVATLEEEHHFPQPERVIAAVRPPKYEMGTSAVALLLDRIAAADGEIEAELPQEIVMPPAPVVFFER